jgi:tetratricopeptide (TPR) repeat protein
MEPDYQDRDNLLLSSEKEVAELNRLNDLNILYGRAVREMDSGRWYEARGLLKQISETEPVFLETERLLAKVDIEVKKAEEKQWREDQISTLYEQARGLIRSRMWREALNKIDEIHKLDGQFIDSDQIAKQAQNELEREEQEIELQNKLTTMYAEAVSLLREKKYQEALEKWQEIVALDSKYPDRQKVQAISKKKLAELTKSPQSRPRIVNSKQVGIIGSLVITLAIIILGSAQFLHIPIGFSSSPTPSALAATESSTPSVSSTPFIAKIWNFDNGTEGWNSGSDINAPKSTDGFLTFTTTGGDPWIFSPNPLQISASRTPFVTVRMRVTLTNSLSGAIFFVTSKDNNFDESKKKPFPLRASDAFEIYDIDMSKISTWQGVITQLRLDPVDDPGTVNDV